MIFQDGDRAMAEVVVEVLDGALDDTFGFVPRAALAEYRFANAGQEKGLP